MGYKHMPWVLEQDGLNTTEKMVLTVLTMHANNETRTTWISLSTLCREAGLSPNSKSSARRALDKLREAGLVTWSERFKDNEQTTHLYTVHWGVGAQNTYPGAQNTHPPVLRTPGVGAESTPDGEPNRELVNEEPDREEVAWSTPSTSRVSRPTSSDRAPGSSDPVSPAFAVSMSRKRIVDCITAVADAERGSIEEAMRYDDLVSQLEMTFPDRPWDHYCGDMGWIPPRKCQDRYEAGAWLNKFLHTVKQDDGPLAWTPTPERTTHR